MLHELLAGMSMIYGVAERQERHCSNHGAFASVEGGKWIVTNKGRNRRWLCAGCVKDRQARMGAAK